MGKKKPSSAAIIIEDAEIPDRPTTPDQLHAAVRSLFDVDLSRTPLIEGHTAPFDYTRWAFFADDNPERSGPADAVVWANRGGGKTFLGALATALDLLYKPGIEIRILGGSMEQAARMHVHLRRLLERPATLPLIDGRITDRRIRLANGSTAELLAQSQASVRGTRVQKVRCDEVELFDPDVWAAVQLTTRSKVCGRTLVRGSIECLSTMHIPHGLMHSLVAEAHAGKRSLFKWGVVDVLGACGQAHVCKADPQEWDGDSPAIRVAGGSPVVKLKLVGGTVRGCPLWTECAGRAKARPGNDAGEGVGHISVWDAIEMKQRVSEATWESEMLCLRPRRDDTVLPEFDPQVHVVSSLPWDSQGAPSPVAWIGGMDFGIRAPAVVLWAAVDAENRVWVVDERVRAGEVLASHIQAIRSAPWPPLAWVGVDPAGNQQNDHTGDSSVGLLKRAGITSRSGRHGMHKGLEFVRARLRPAAGEPRLFVHRRCTRLIESLERYHYPRNNPESPLPEKDGFDHAVDALRYMIQSLDAPCTSAQGTYV